MERERRREYREYEDRKLNTDNRKDGFGGKASGKRAWSQGKENHRCRESGRAKVPHANPAHHRGCRQARNRRQSPDRMHMDVPIPTDNAHMHESKAERDLGGVLAAAKRFLP